MPAEADRGPRRADRDAPVPRRRIVHRVVELRRRDAAPSGSCSASRMAAITAPSPLALAKTVSSAAGPARPLSPRPPRPGRGGPWRRCGGARSAAGARAAGDCASAGPRGAAPASTGRARRPARQARAEHGDAADPAPHASRPITRRNCCRRSRRNWSARGAPARARLRDRDVARNAGSGASTPRQPGTSPSSHADARRPPPPARPRRPAYGRSSPWWSCTARYRRRREHGAVLHRVIGARAGAVHVDVVDRRPAPARPPPAPRACADRARPSGCGEDMWCPSLLAPAPSSAARLAGAASGRSSSTRPAASPMLMPSRSAAQGREGPRPAIPASRSRAASGGTACPPRRPPPHRRARPRSAPPPRGRPARPRCRRWRSTRRPAQPEPRAHVARQRVQVVGAGVVEIGRQGRRPRRRRGIGLLGLLDAGGGGAEHHRDALGAMALARARATASAKPSWRSASSARRLLRQAKAARPGGGAAGLEPRRRGRSRCRPACPGGRRAPARRAARAAPRASARSRRRTAVAAVIAVIGVSGPVGAPYPAAIIGARAPRAGASAQASRKAQATPIVTVSPIPCSTGVAQSAAARRSARWTRRSSRRLPAVASAAVLFGSSHGPRRGTENSRSPARRATAARPGGTG